MTEDELREIRGSLLPLDADARRMPAALLAHIDALATCDTCHEPWAHHSCRLGVKGLVDERDALAAEVERLKEAVAQEKYFRDAREEDNDSLRDLVREAKAIIERDPMWVMKEQRRAWLKKAKA